MVKKNDEKENALSEMKDLRKLVEADRTWMEKEIVKMDEKIKSWTNEIIELVGIVKNIENKIYLPAQRYYNEVHIESPQVINKILAIETELNARMNAIANNLCKKSVWDIFNNKLGYNIWILISLVTLGGGLYFFAKGLLKLYGVF